MSPPKNRTSSGKKASVANKADSAANSKAPTSSSTDCKKAKTSWFLRAWTEWQRLLSLKETGTTLAIFRIAVATVVASSLLATVFSDVVDMIWVGKDFGGLNRIRRIPFWIDLLGGPTKNVVHGMLALCLFSLFCVGSGFRTRIAALVAGQSYMSLYRLNPFAHGSYDIVITNALWILVLAESSRTLSIDCKLRCGKWQSDDEVSAWPRGLVILNLALMYGTTGIQKVSFYWTPVGGYSALYYILPQPSWHNFDMSWAASFYLLTQIGTFVSWTWEVTSPLLLFAVFFVRLYPEGKARWRRPLRWLFARRIDLRVLFVLVGISMHSLIVIFMSVGPFSYISMSLYICLFSSAEWNRFFQRGRILFARIKSGSASPRLDAG